METTVTPNFGFNPDLSKINANLISPSVFLKQFYLRPSCCTCLESLCRKIIRKDFCIGRILQCSLNWKWILHMIIKPTLQNKIDSWCFYLLLESILFLGRYSFKQIYVFISKKGPKPNSTIFYKISHSTEGYLICN